MEKGSECIFIFEAKWSTGSTAGPGLTGSVTGLCKCSVGAMYKRVFKRFPALLSGLIDFGILCDNLNLSSIFVNFFYRKCRLRKFECTSIFF